MAESMEEPGTSTELPVASLHLDDTMDFASAFHQHLSEYVPRIYTNCTEAKVEKQERRAESSILIPLEWYLLGEDPKAFTERLRQSEAPPSLCGRVFTPGETTYSCRECAIDPTCVLCMKCFQNSDHQNHRYKMHSSSGGGFCDCGDVEAWKTSPYCKVHEPGMSDQSSAFRVPENILAKTSKVFPILIRYLVDMLVWEAEKTLPEHLNASQQKSDYYYCMLYGGEIRTTDPCVYSLQRVMHYNVKEARIIAGAAEREGRITVKEGSYEECKEIADGLKKYSESMSRQHLNVDVLSSLVMAHQAFACSLGTWLNTFLAYSSDFRQLFCQICLEPNALNGLCYVGFLIRNDAKIHKGFRKVFYELIFNSYFMNMDYKKLFAFEFVEHYRNVHKEHIDDDHDKDISLTGFSVQLFTVPTLARLLIEEKSIIRILTETLVDLLPICFDTDKFTFQNYSQDRFLRVYTILCDLKYILANKPTSWSEKLETMFMDGFDALLQFLSMMQDMEGTPRIIGQHVEMETDWETAISMQMQLKNILTLIQEWFASNEDLLFRAYKECHHWILQCIKPVTSVNKIRVQLCGHSYETYPFKVSRDPVSIYLPLSRTLAGLHSHMSRMGVLPKLHDYIPLDEYKIEQLIESPLRCLVLLGQVAAEMWRRNGLTVVSQVFYYHDVKCREEMYDKDIVMMQVGASYMDPNNFLLMMIDKYELMEALSQVSVSFTDMDLAKQTNIIIEEMLHALICIISERYVPGVSNVTKEECLIREIVHLLCIEPMSHSALIKALPDTENINISLDTLINRVSTFKKPGISGHGVYELKEEYLPQYNVLFYHYSKSQRSKAEDAQKKRRKQENISEALPPPPPPDFTPAFQNVTNLLCSDVMMHLLRILLQRALEEEPALWSESMIQMALHLIALGLIEEKRQLQEASEQGITFDFYYKASRLGSSDPNSYSVVTLLDKLRSLNQLEAQKDMICWLKQMMETVKRLHEKSEQTAIAGLSSDVGKVDASPTERESRKRKAEAAKQHRQRIMAQMTALQKNFIETNKFLYDTTQKVHEVPPPMEEISLPTEEGSKIALGPNRGPCLPEKKVVTCILCQEEQEVRLDLPTMVLTSFIQKSTTLCQNRDTTVVLSGETFDSIFTSPELSVGTYSGGCGHVMHGSCWQKFYAAIEVNRRHQLHVDMIYEMVRGEYLCPFCKCHCNTAMPIHPIAGRQVKRVEAEALGQVLTLPCWLDVVAARISGYSLNIYKGKKSVSPEFHKCTENQNYEFRSILSFGVQPPPSLSACFKDGLVQYATKIYQVGLGVPPSDNDPRLPMSWHTCAYTIQAVENLLQEEGKPLFGSLQICQYANLKALVKCVESQRVTSLQTTVQSHLVQLLAVFLPNLTLEGTPSLLSVDAFHLLVGSVMAFPSLYWEEGADLHPSTLVSAYNHLYLFHLITIAHILQIIFTSSTGKVPSVSSDDSEEAVSAATLCHDLSLFTNGCLSNIPGWHVWDCVKRGILPYLRSSALFFHYLLGVSPPDELNSIVMLEDQFDALCSYLCLPTNLFLLFEEYRDTVKPIIQRWCADPAILSVLAGESMALRYPRKRNTLVELPEHYSTLLNQVSHFRCPKSQHTERKQPVMCLLCGALLCSYNTCCQETVNGEELGSCTLHSINCGAGICIFLKIRECKVIIIEAKTRGCAYPAPYLDEYGETDPGLKRGNPLRLSHERYRKLHLLWLQHSLVEEIALTLEGSELYFGFNWTVL